MHELVVELLTDGAILAGITILGWLGLRTKHHAQNADDAVNHRHQGTPRLFDAVMRSLEATDRLDRKVDRVLDWKQSVNERFGRVEKSVDKLHQRLDDG